MDMQIDFVSRRDMDISQKSTKYQPILRAIHKLKEGGQAVKVSYENKSELNSIRNVVYRYNRETGDKVKSTKHSGDRIVYFYK